MDKKLTDILENTVRIGKNIIRSQSDIETATDLVHGVTDSLSKAGINESCSVDLSSSVASIMKHLGVGKEDLSTDEVAQSGSHNFQQPQDNLVYMQTLDLPQLSPMNVNNNQSVTNVPSYQPQNALPQSSAPGQIPHHQPFNSKMYKRLKAANRVVRNWNKQFVQGDQLKTQGRHLDMSTHNLRMCLKPLLICSSLHKICIILLITTILTLMDIK